MGLEFSCIAIEFSDNIHLQLQVLFPIFQRMRVFEKSCEIKGVQLPKDFGPNMNQEANEIDQLFDDLELQSTCGIGLWTN